MALAVFFFSLMNLGVKYLGHLPVFELVLFRSLVAAGIAYVTLRVKGISPWGNRKDLLILRGLIGFCALATFFVTLQNMPLASAVTIQYLSPLFVAVLSIFLLGEPMSPLQWVWFLLATVGVVMIKGFDARVSVWYLGLGVFSAMCSGFAYNMVRKLRAYDHPLVVTFYFPLVTLPLSAGVTLYDWVAPVGWEWLALLGTGVMAQMGQLFMTMSLHLEKANIVASVKYLGILYGLIYGYWLFDESYSWGSLAGIVLILSGIGFNILLPSKKVSAA